MENTKILDRLRASEEAYYKKLETDGYQAGVNWVNTNAETHQLRRFEEAHYKLHDDYFEDNRASFYLAADLFYFVIEGRHGDTEAAAAFWNTITFGQKPSQLFVQGFARGVIRRWLELQEQLYPVGTPSSQQ